MRKEMETTLWFHFRVKPFEIVSFLSTIAKLVLIFPIKIKAFLFPQQNKNRPPLTSGRSDAIIKA